MRIFNWTREDGRPTREWCRDDTHGTHVPLPLDASAVPDAVVVAAAYALYVDTCVSEDPKPWNMLKNSDKEYFTDVARTVIRAAIAALAQALGEVGDE